MSSESSLLPAPSAAQRARSAALAARIRAAIEAAGGWLRFDRYMQAALYEPGLGYYGAPGVELGPGGDFTTAAELGDFLPRAVAALCAQLFPAAAATSVLELGAGTGALARHLLDALAGQGQRDVRYRILEPSASLRARQEEHLARHADRVTWLTDLPDKPLDGLIFANEVADALPVVRFVKTAHGALPLGVRADGAEFRWQVGAADPELSRAVGALEARLDAPLPEGYRSEICLALPAWLAALAASLGRGAILLVDYGLPRRELYHVERSDGTLICHYRHRAHADPFRLPGLTDISAWVDFSACADAGAAAGLTVAGFTTQAHFLLETAAASGARPVDRRGITELNALKTLLLPGEMGERFKVLLFCRGLRSCALPGRDLRSRL